jgi:hypothetical protein
LIDATEDTSLETPDGIAIVQWMQNSILSDPGLLLPGVPTTYTSMNEIEMDFIVDPEV